MLEVRSIARRYGEVRAVDDVSFTVNQGEVVGLLGHNGAGKTTIMKMISGFLEPDAGQILLDRRSVVDEPALLQRTLGYLPENLPVYPELSVAEYLDYAARLKGLDGDTKRAEIRRAIDATELRSKFLAPIGTLSRGFKQRAGVAQAILGSPSLLILDEPTNGLDPAQTEQMRSLIRNLSAEATIVLSTHIMQEVEAICDRALILRRGQLAVDATLADLTRGDRLSLTTDVEAERVSSELAGITEVLTVTRSTVGLTKDGSGERRTGSLSITLKANSDPYAAISQITRKLVQADVSVMEIRPDTRDLQTLFMEVNTSDLVIVGNDQSINSTTVAKEEVGDAA